MTWRVADVCWDEEKRKRKVEMEQSDREEKERRFKKLRIVGDCVCVHEYAAYYGIPVK